jgi:hypothetical protein
MNFLQKIASAVGLTLFISIVVPMQATGYDPGTITKTVTVEKSDGTRYGAGATVALAFLNADGFVEFVSPVLTNIDGVASVSVDGSRNYIGLAVAASVSDSVHGLEFLDGRSGNEPEIEITRWNQSFEVTLREAAFFVNPYSGSTGTTPAPVGTGFTLWESGMRPQELFAPRTGKIGIALSSDSGDQGYTSLRINSSTLDFFGQEVSFEGDVSSLVPVQWMQFPYNSSTRTADIRLLEANIAGQLVDVDGNPASLGDGVKATIRFVREEMAFDEAEDVWEGLGTPDPYSLASSGYGLGQVNSDGSFAGQVEWLPETVEDGVIGYFPQVYVAGSDSLPTFLGQAFYVSFNGSAIEFADSSDMSSPTSTLEVSVPPASDINLRLYSVRKGGFTPDSAIINIENLSDPRAQWGRSIATNGEASYVLPDGDYGIWVTPTSGARGQGYYELSISGAEIALSQCCEYDAELQQEVELVISPFETGTSSASFYVSGALDDDLRVVVSNPITGELLPASDVSGYVGFNSDSNQNSRQNDGRFFQSIGGGVFAVDIPDEYYTGSPLVIGVELSRNSTADPLLTRIEYTVVRDEDTLAYSILDSAGVTLSPTTSSNEADSDTYILPLSYANVFGNLVDFQNQRVERDFENDSYVFGNIQKYVASQGRWDYLRGGLSVRDDGSFGIELENGIYRIIFTPQGYEQIAETTTPTFTISDEIPTWSFSNFVMSQPLFAIEVVEPNGSVALENAHVQIRDESRDYYSGVGTGWSGRANLSLGAGTYELIAEAPFQRRSELPKRSYQLEITGSPGDLTATITRDGVSVPSTMSGTLQIFTLELGTPNLRGVVRDPSGRPVADAQVMPVDPVTGWDMWEISVPTGQDGSWSIDLAEGTYDLYARTPWGSTDFGNGVLLTGIQVDSEGQVVEATLPAGSTANNLVLQLRNPAFSGTVVDPNSGALMTNVEVCLFGPTSGTCVVTDHLGRWALSEPQGFEGFDGWELLVREYFDARYSAARFRDAVEIEAALQIEGGYVSGTIYENRTLTLPEPNVKIRVMAGDNPAPGAWVSLDGPGFWTGVNSDEDGYARLFVDNPTSSMTARVDIGNIRSLAGQFTGTQGSLNFSDGQEDENGIFSATLSLAVPNLFFSVRTPGGTTSVPFAWVELFDGNGERWLKGSSADRSGNGSMFLSSESSQVDYVLKVNPSGNASQFARSYFSVSVAVDGSVTVSDVDGALTPDPTNDRLVLELSTPNVTGRVVQPDSSSTPVRDSYVVPIDSISDWYLWQLGTNSDRNGEFSMNLDDGTYRLEASVPYYLTGLARSAPCEVTITSGSLSAVQTGCGSTSGVVLTLREPNLKFRLVKGDDSLPTAFANVGARIGDYSVFTQADRLGVVSLFLDSQEMFDAADKALTRGWISDQDGDSSNGIQVPITFWIDPPWGSDDIVRWECETNEQEPLCSKAGLDGIEKINGTWQTWSEPGDLGDVRFKEPNTRVQIRYPNLEPVNEGAWVNLFVETGSWREWVSGGNTNAEGFALFDIPAAMHGSSFSLEINAPWFERSVYPSRIFTGLELDTSSVPFFSLTGVANFSLPTKNLQIEVDYLSGEVNLPARSSWVSVETIQTVSGSVVYNWTSGNQTDSGGRAAFYLEPNADVVYKLTVHPGPGVVGTQFSCVVGSDGADITAASWVPNGETDCGALTGGVLSITLGTGNVRGKVTDSSSDEVAGVIVVAANTLSGEIVTAVTNQSGDYFMDIADTATWEIRFIALDSSSLDPFVTRKDATDATGGAEDDVLIITPPSSGQDTHNVVLYRESEVS